jgi:hypothetical protein
MADTIIDGTQFNVQNIKYSSPKANASGGKSINILNKLTNTGLRLSTPLLLTWGASDFQDPQTGKGNGKFELSLQFPSSEYANEDTNAFFKNLQALEQKIKDDALTNSKEWFGKVHKNAEVVEALYTPILKYSKDKATGEPDYTRAPTFRVKIPSWEGVYRCEVYDEEGEKLFPNVNTNVSPVELIQKGTNVATLIQCGGIWFANGKFGVTWKLAQIVVQKPRGGLTGQCLIKLKTADKEKLKAVVAPEVTVLDDDDLQIGKSTLVDDSDEEDEEQHVVASIKAEVTQAVVEANVEEPAKKKKVVKKKAAEVV